MPFLNASSSAADDRHDDARLVRTALGVAIGRRLRARRRTRPSAAIAVCIARRRGELPSRPPFFFGSSSFFAVLSSFLSAVFCRRWPGPPRPSTSVAISRDRLRVERDRSTCSAPATVALPVSFSVAICFSMFVDPVLRRRDATRTSRSLVPARVAVVELLQHVDEAVRGRSQACWRAATPFSSASFSSSRLNSSVEDVVDTPCSRDFRDELRRAGRRSPPRRVAIEMRLALLNRA